MAQIYVVSIPVRDQSVASQFYQDVLDFRLITDMPMPQGGRWVQLAPSEGVTSITLVTWFETMPAGSLRGLVLNTKEIAADHARFRERGLQISEIKQEPWGSFATFNDRDGNGWILQQEPTPNSL